jgi:hypothetical protein
MRRRPSLIVLPVVVASVLILVGPAAGRWSPGPGSQGGGTALVASSIAVVTISQIATTSSLYPTGIPSGDVALRLTNPTTSAFKLSRLMLDTTRGTLGFAVDSAHAACTVSSLSFTTQTNGGNGWTVPAKGTLDVYLVSAITLATSAPNACQGATFTVYLTS